MYQILLYYKYTKLENPEQVKLDQVAKCKELNLKGRILIAEEGINGTLEGLAKDTEKYIEWMNSQGSFKDIHWKKSAGTGAAFPKLKVKVRKEIVSSFLGREEENKDNEEVIKDDYNLKDLDPNKLTGKYLTPAELHDMIHSGKEFYFVDMRNDYEMEVGRFVDSDEETELRHEKLDNSPKKYHSILAPFENFRDLPRVLPKLESLKDKTIVTVCTGGVRCEKASGFLVQNGFKDVYQIYGGIVSYMAKYPNEDFLGQLYVFDNRIVMGFNLDDPSRVIVGKCNGCGKPTEHYGNCAIKTCNKHMLICEECSKGDVLCPKCKENSLK